MLKKIYIFSIVISFILFSCSREENLLDLQDLPISFTTSVVKDNVATRVTGDNWDKGDKIGVFVIQSGATLSDATIVENYNNLLFSTLGSGIFKNEEQPIYYPDDGTFIDFIAYYPYKPNIISYVYPIDISEQVDFLYSRNAKNANKENPNNNLNFERVLSHLVLNIQSKANISLEELAVEINGVKTKASFSLVDGELAVDDKSEGVLFLNPSGTDKKKQVSSLLLPTAQKNSVKVVLKLGDGSTYKWTVPHAFESGKRYTHEIKLDGKSVDVTPTTSYMEIPYFTSGGDAPNTLVARHMVGSTTWLNGYRGPNTAPNTQRNYTILFDTENAVPLWIAYPLHPIYMASGNRTNAWDYDPIIPKKYQSDNNGWTNSTYNRGHMLASADRSATRDLNRTTFYATNMVPQNTRMNSGVWNQLEEKMRDWAHEFRYDTLYVVTGSILAPKAQTEYTFDESGKRVAVPNYLYKALLRQEKSTKKWYSIAFKMENKSNATHYQNSVISVDELEKETGFTFFPNLPDVAKEVKKQNSLSHWN